MTKILLVEDDLRILAVLKRDLQFERYTVDVAQDGEEGWDYLSQFVYDLVILDVMLPKLDGLGLCSRMRRQGLGVPVLMLTARDTTLDKVQGLDAGADDYLAKPFELTELHARIRSLLRRHDPQRKPTLEQGLIVLDPANKLVLVLGTRVDLTAKEYMLLEHFLRHPNQVFSRDQLIERLWNWDETPGSDVVKAHLKGLRRKLKEAGATDPIEAVHGLGYRLSAGV
ncbi:two-component system response regulator RppA [Anthocerotibacter panamensis]|uniref:two-component system response regulator RppA n=1 Tax=Anthocerotibacter panamensis TaxID=2857077 RepID=UPI001C40866A|nr:two-component system response regulator RppA [Anthocerotibacter panamensis]